MSRKRRLKKNKEAGPKKPFYKRWWFIALVAFIVIGAFGGDDEEVASEEDVTEEVAEAVEEVEEEVEEEKEELPDVKPKKKSTPKPTPAPKPKSKPVEVEEEPEPEPEEQEFDEDTLTFLMEEMMVSIMEDNFEGMATIEFDREEKSFSIIPIDSSITLGALLAAEGNPESLEAWNSLMDGVAVLSQSIHDEIGPGYFLNLVNTSNQDNLIAMAMDGVVVYDAVRDSGFN